MADLPHIREFLQDTFMTLKYIQLGLHAHIHMHAVLVLEYINTEMGYKVAPKIGDFLILLLTNSVSTCLKNSSNGGLFIAHLFTYMPFQFF